MILDPLGFFCIFGLLESGFISPKFTATSWAFFTPSGARTAFEILRALRRKAYALPIILSSHGNAIFVAV